MGEKRLCVCGKWFHHRCTCRVDKAGPAKIHQPLRACISACATWGRGATVGSAGGACLRCTGNSAFHAARFLLFIFFLFFVFFWFSSLSMLPLVDACVYLVDVDRAFSA